MDYINPFNECDSTAKLYLSVYVAALYLSFFV
jgi:hypothetical protein